MDQTFPQCHDSWCYALSPLRSPSTPSTWMWPSRQRASPRTGRWHWVCWRLPRQWCSVLEGSKVNIRLREHSGRPNYCMFLSCHHAPHVACGCRSSGLKLDGLKFGFFVWHLAKMASRLRLTYFDDNKGRNELTRLIFAVGQISFEDELIGFPEYLRRRDAAALPFDQIPTLQVGDTVLGQSCAIARYAARLAKLYPEDPLMASVADAVVDSWRDQLDLLYDTFFERTVIAGKLQMFPRQQHERAWRIRVYMETSFRPWMMQMERKLMQGRFCPPDLTYAELAVFDLVCTVEGFVHPDVFKDVMQSHQKVASLVRQVGEIPSIAEHLQQHPYTVLSDMFSEPNFVKQTLEFVMFPCMKLALSSWLGLKYCFRSS